MFYGYGDAIKDWEAYDAQRSANHYGDEGSYCPVCGRYIPEGEEYWDDDDNLICDDCLYERRIAEMTPEELERYQRESRSWLATA